MYGPHVLPWFPRQDPTLCGAFLRPWPPLTAAQLARRRTLERFCHPPPMRDAQRLHACRGASKSAVPLTSDAGGMMPQALLAQALMAQGRVRCETLERFEQAMAARAPRHPDDARGEALPGAGPA